MTPKSPILGAKARYDGAGHGRRFAGWSAPSSGPRAATSGGIATLRNRARDLVRNDPVACAAVRVLANSIVGFGISCRPNTQDPAQKKRITPAWNAWWKVAPTDGADFAALQVLVARAYVTDGECFVRLRSRRPEDGLPALLQLEALESDMLPTLDADTWPGLPTGYSIRQGIEFDAIGRRSAYWFHRAHPGEPNAFAPTTTAGDLVRVPAESVLHVFEPQRIGQLRGVTPFAPAIAKLRTVGDFDDAVVERQKLANLFTAFVKKPQLSGDSDPLTGLAAEGTLDAPLAGLEPGMLQELLPGEEIQFSSPPDAGANYADFMRQQHLLIGAAVGIPPEMLTGELRDISDRTLRFAVGEYRRRIEQITWTVLVPRFLQPVREAWSTAAALAPGGLSPIDAREAVDCVWAPQMQPYIHPTQDVATLETLVSAGFKSRASVIAERGDDPAEVDAERAEDRRREATQQLDSNGLGFQDNLKRIQNECLANM